MEKTKHSPDEYITSLPEDKRTDIEKLDELISKIFKKHSRVMWEGVFWGGTNQQIIGYGDLTFIDSNKKEVEWFMVGLSLQKNYISLSVNAVKDKKYLLEQHKEKLGKVKTGRSTITFPHLANIELSALEELLKEAEKLV